MKPKNHAPRVRKDKSVQKSDNKSNQQSENNSGADKQIPRNQEAHKLEGAFSTLIPRLQDAVAKEGYVTPTPIQEQCIDHILKGKDLMGSAQTGTGKTAAFTLPILQQLAKSDARPQKGTPRALILAPTRELAAQIGDSIRTYGQFLKLSHTVIFGGVGQHPQVKALNRGVDIIVATPGRLLDLINQKFIRLNKVEFFILDEADRMLDMGFVPDIKKVLKMIPEERQTLFFSATMSATIIELAHTMVHDPIKIAIEPEKLAVEKINQKVLFVDKKDKDALLVSLFNDTNIYKAIIFTQMKHMADKVVKKLTDAGVKATAIHGNKSQSARTKALDGFKRGKFQALVATDVAARGLDVDDITHVINYDLPVEDETYVHRIGRTARAGSEGDAISFCSAEDRSYLRSIEKLLGQSVPADMEHAFHSEKSFRSTQAPPSNFGRRSGGGGGRGGRSGGGRGGSSRRASSGKGGPGKREGNYARFQKRKRNSSNRGK